MKADDRLGPWVLVERLGRGGNGEVWRCRRNGQVEAAVKVLLRPGDRERLGRFCNEIGFLLSGGNRQGVVPLIDHDLRGPKFVWYAMPLATPLRTALGSDPRPEDVVRVVAEIVGTLTDLASEGISHRDIKPDNLFLYAEQPALGDFGLVKYPSGEPLTRHGRKLGPTDFMAPEMREDPDSADAELADVYSIAKTLWVLLAGTNIPIPGQHRADDEMCRLTNRIASVLAPHLDLLIERCTSNDPSKRLRLAEVVHELRAMIDPTGGEGAALDDTSGLERRIAALTERHSRNDATRQKFYESCSGAWHRLKEEVAQPAFWEIVGRLPSFGTRHPVQLAPPRVLLLKQSVYPGTDGWAGSIVSPGAGRVRVDVGFVLRVLDDTGRCTVAAVVRINRSNRRRGLETTILEEVVESTTSSAHFDQTVARLQDLFEACVPTCLAAVAEALEAEEADEISSRES